MRSIGFSDIERAVTRFLGTAWNEFDDETDYCPYCDGRLEFGYGNTDINDDYDEQYSVVLSGVKCRNCGAYGVEVSEEYWDEDLRHCDRYFSFLAMEDIKD